MRTVYRVDLKLYMLADAVLNINVELFIVSCNSYDPGFEEH